MNLKEMAQQILSKSGTASGSKSGTGFSKEPMLIQSRGTAKNRMNAGASTNCHTVPNVYTGTLGHLQKNGTPLGTDSGTLVESDPFLDSGTSIKVSFPALNHDVWLCSDEKARTMVEGEGLTCLLFTDIQYILQGKPGGDRLNRLHKAIARRHRVTEETLKLFNGKITSIKDRWNI